MFSRQIALVLFNLCLWAHHHHLVPRWTCQPLETHFGVGAPESRPDPNPGEGRVALGLGRRKETAEEAWRAPVLPSALTSPRLLRSLADALAAAAFFIRFRRGGLRGYGAWEDMKGERGHRSGQGSSSFQSLSPLELPERNFCFLCRRVGEGEEGRGVTNHWESCLVGSHRE